MTPGSDVDSSDTAVEEKNDSQVGGAGTESLAPSILGLDGQHCLGDMAIGDKDEQEGSHQEDGTNH